MNLATILGVILGVGLLTFSIWFSGQGGDQGPEIFWNWPSLMIVLGGTIASTFISFPMQVVARVFASMLLVFKTDKVDMVGPWREIVQLASVGRQGIGKLEAEIQGVRDFFLRDGVQMVVDGYNENDLQHTLETRINAMIEQEEGEAHVFRVMASFSPAYGMLGTLVGLVYLLGNMSDPSRIGPNMAVALVTTFYGVIFANLFFGPFAEKLSKRTDERVHLRRMIADGVLLLAARQHPFVVGDKLSSYLKPSERMRPEDVLAGGAKG